MPPESTFPIAQKASEALKTYFGFSTFRPLQLEITEAVLNGHDCLVLMPTGGGKSLCYQLPALLTDGICIVVSPLISLMRNQVQALRANGIGAGILNSSIDDNTQRNVEQAALNGTLKLLYVSPERLVTDAFLNFLRRLKINLFAIDEAHCVSSWGHDFRPEYRQLSNLKEHFPNTPILALTATADRPTRHDIVKSLNLYNPQEFVSSFSRPNIHLAAQPGQERMRQVLRFLAQNTGQSGIIYCLSRKET